MNQEIELIVKLSKPYISTSDIAIIKNLLNSELNWDKLIGVIEIHRIPGIIWTNLNKYIFTDKKVNHKFPILYKYLEFRYSFQKLKFEEQLKNTLDICELFELNNIRYVLLKGITITHLYNDTGIRDFNDNDFLIHPNDITKATSVLIDKGYIQGELLNNKELNIPTRKEKVIRAYTSHEVYPFVLNLDDTKILNSHIIDLHFSINLMSKEKSDDVVDKWLTEFEYLEFKNKSIRALNPNFAFLFLCEHFYKEATSLRDLLKYKDLLLYKFCDIAYFMKYNDMCYEEIIKLIEEYDYQKQVFFTLKYVKEVFMLPTSYEQVLQYLEHFNDDFINNVMFYDSLDVAYTHRTSIINRIFDLKKPSYVSNTNEV